MIQQDLPVDALMARAPQDMQARWKDVQTKRKEIREELKRQLVPVTKEHRQGLALKSLQARKEAKAHSASHNTVGNTGLLLSPQQHFSSHSAQYPPTASNQSMSRFHVQEPEISELDRAREEFKQACRGNDFPGADAMLQAMESHNRPSLLNEEFDRELWNITDNYFPFSSVDFSRFSYLLEKGANPQTLEARWLTILFQIFCTPVEMSNADENGTNVRLKALFESLDKLISSEGFDPNTELYGGTALAHFMRFFCYGTESDLIDGGDCSFRRGGWPEYIITRLLEKGAVPGPDVRMSREVQMGEELIAPMMCKGFRAIYERWRN